MPEKVSQATYLHLVGESSCPRVLPRIAIGFNGIQATLTTLDPRLAPDLPLRQFLRLFRRTARQIVTSARNAEHTLRCSGSGT